MKNKKETKTDFKEKSKQLHFYNQFCEDFRMSLFALTNEYEKNLDEYQFFQDLDFEKQKDYNMDFYAEYLATTYRTIEDMQQIFEERRKEYYDHIIND